MYNETRMKKLCAFLLLFAVISAPATSLALVPEDPLYGNQWYLRKINVPGAWDITTGSRNVVIAVLDAGVDINHEDLAGNIWQNSGEIAGNNIDDDGNGFIDDVNGWDFVQGSNNVFPVINGDTEFDAVSHGTLIAGLIGAIGDNTTGVTGVNWRASIMPLRTLNESGAGTSAQVSKAMRYAVDMGADVINLSFSGNESDVLLRQAMKYAYDNGVVVVAALGNDGRNVNTSPVYPGCYGTVEEDWVIGVSATNLNDERAEFANYGSTCTDLSAPGVDIFGLSYFDVVAGFNEPYEGGWNGTSMAAPLVAGVAGLLRAAYPDISPRDMKTVLQLSVDALPATPDRQEMGAGRLNAGRALEIGKEYSLAHAAVPGEIRYVKSTASPSVYRVTETGGRRVFMDTNSFFTHSSSFAEIEEVSAEILATFPLEGLMLPKAETVLVKIESDPRVYRLSENISNPFSPLLREIASEEIAVQLYGTDWADYVIDVESTFFTKFTKGIPVNSQESVNTSIMLKRNQLVERAQ